MLGIGQRHPWIVLTADQHAWHLRRLRGQRADVQSEAARGGGRGQKRKAIDELNGLFTDTQLDEWLHEVGGSDAMLDGLLGP